MGLKENQALAAQYPILQYFKYYHLPEELRKISAPFNTLAWKIARELPSNAETSTALRKLLEAKDAAVRAGIAEENVDAVPTTQNKTTEAPAHPFVEGYPKPSN